MHIEIDDRLRPFSHLPGTACLLPGSFYQIRVFPSLIQIHDISKSVPENLIEISVGIAGPLEEFTILQDLEKGRIVVWGSSPKGLMRYFLTAGTDGKGIELRLEKAPKSEPLLFSAGKEYFLSEKESFRLFADNQTFQGYSASSLVRERLSLGNNKAQDWELVKRRLDPKEILPAWYSLGLLVPPLPYRKCDKGNMELLSLCEEIIAAKKNDASMQSLINLFRAGFSGILMPRLNDLDYQGLTRSSYSHNDLSPLILLREGANLIRKLFVEQEQTHVRILPFLPPELPYGRFTQIQIQGGILSIEWTKKVVRRATFYSLKTQELFFDFRHIRSFRLREGNDDKGRVLSCGIPVTVQNNNYYYFDNFN